MLSRRWRRSVTLSLLNIFDDPDPVCLRLTERFMRQPRLFYSMAIEGGLEAQSEVATNFRDGRDGPVPIWDASGHREGARQDGATRGAGPASPFLSPTDPRSRRQCA